MQHLICIIIIFLLMIYILRKEILKLIEKIKISLYIKGFFKIIFKFLYKFVEIFWMIALSLVILVPLFLYYLLRKVLNISYEEYKNFLEIILKSNYVIIIGIIIIVYLFRNEIKNKINQIKKVKSSDNEVEFGESTQVGKNMEAPMDMRTEKCEETYDMNDYIYEKVKENFETKENKNDNYLQESPEEQLKRENEELKNKLEETEYRLKRENFMNIKMKMASTTNIILLYLYSEYRESNSFKITDIKEKLKETSNDLKINLDLETIAIFNFLRNNKIIDTEDESEFGLTEYGKEYLTFLFGGGE